MYNDPAIINQLSQKIIAEMGWDEITDRRVSEQYIQNAVRSELRPADREDEITKNRIIATIIDSIRRLKPLL